MDNINIVADGFTEIIARFLDSQDNPMNESSRLTTAQEFRDADKRWLYRYHSENIFHAKVMSVVSDLIISLRDSDNE